MTLRLLSGRASRLRSGRERAGAFVAAALLFGVLATANSGGYRYGISDQAFYATAVVKQINPSLFPRDTPLLQTQARWMWCDEIVAGLSRMLGVRLPSLEFALYLATLVLLFAGAVAFGRALGLSWHAIAMLLLLLTLRHRIAKTGANSLEGYMHPRQLAFAFGLFALAAVVKQRGALTMLSLALSALWHPTTALWFAVAAGIALAVAKPSSRRPLALMALVGAIAAGWMIARGPLAGRLVRMDDAWLKVLSEKDYLFPSRWPAYAWAANLGYLAVIAMTYRRRRLAGLTSPGERGLVIGLAMLAVVFLMSVPFTAARIALAVQLQITRVFWVIDFCTVAYIAWWLLESARRSRVMQIAAISVVAIISAARGWYVVRIAQPDRPLVRVELADTPWVDAMNWLRSQPSNWHVLADPRDADKYGVSLRLAAEKDTVLEATKDSALAIYDRDIAMRVGDRMEHLARFGELTTADARELDQRYDLDAVIVESTCHLDLPMLYRNAMFVIYDLR